MSSWGQSAHTPAVSVIIPAYKVTAFIAEALDSVLAQTFQDYEIIVVNDGCPDTGHLEIVLEPYRPHIRYVRQENRGPSAARNTGIRMSAAPLLAFLDADDIWEPEFLTVQVAMMHSDPTIAVLYCNGTTFGDIETPPGKTAMDFFPSTGKVSFLKLLKQECNVLVSLTARRDSIVEAGMFDEAIRRCEDWDMWLRVARRGGRIEYHRRPLVRYRRHGGNASADSVRMYAAGLDLLAKVERTMDLTGEEHGALLRKRNELEGHRNLYLGKRAIRDHDYAAAREYIGNAGRRLKSPKLRFAVFALTYFPRLLKSVMAARERLARPHTNRKVSAAPTQRQSAGRSAVDENRKSGSGCPVETESGLDSQGARSHRAQV